MRAETDGFALKNWKKSEAWVLSLDEFLVADQLGARHPPARFPFAAQSSPNTSNQSPAREFLLGFLSLLAYE